MGKTLYEKIWQDHEIESIDSERSQIFIDLHLIHEVTSPQAFAMLKESNLPVAFPSLTKATVDHIVPTDDISRPFEDSMAEEMIQNLKKNTKDYGIDFHEMGSGNQGIVHVIGPELGLTRPGSIIVCGDSHTSTHGAFGAIAFGIGTTQVRDVLASQSLITKKLKVKKIELNGKASFGVTAKDIILYVIQQLGVQGGNGLAYEYCGSYIESCSMEERMTICNMSIEGGARCGYINPDQKTFDYLRNRIPDITSNDFKKFEKKWSNYRSDPDAEYQDKYKIDVSTIEPMATWGTNPAQSVSINNTITFSDANEKRDSFSDSLEYMKLKEGGSIKGLKIDKAFIGSCTNGRLSDFLSVLPIIKNRKIPSHVKALAVPGSEKVDEEAKKLGIDKVFIESGFEWRKPGCSMCLAMNPDKLNGSEVCVSSSNRNFKGRQGSSTGRTILMSPLGVAASAINGMVSDPREFL